MNDKSLDGAFRYRYIEGSPFSAAQRCCRRMTPISFAARTSFSEEGISLTMDILPSGRATSIFLFLKWSSIQAALILKWSFELVAHHYNVYVPIQCCFTLTRHGDTIRYNHCAAAARCSNHCCCSRKTSKKSLRRRAHASGALQRREI